MPALSPTMTDGKIVKWTIKEGDEFDEGDALCEIETDKATVPFEASEKGVLAKILADDNKSYQVGDTLAVSVKKKEDVSKFSDFTFDSLSGPKTESKPAQKTE